MSSNSITDAHARGLAEPGRAVNEPSNDLRIQVDCGEALDVREFVVRERMSSLFEIVVRAFSRNPDVDFNPIVGRPAGFTIVDGARTGRPDRAWSGICRHIEQISVEERGLSSYELTIVPSLWLLTQRRNHRMFQQISELDIVKTLLAEWDIEPEVHISGIYKTRKYRVQYGESDYAFVCRMLEDAGISFYFAQDGHETKLVLSDAPQSNERRLPAIPYRDHPTASERETVTNVRTGQRVRPGRYTLRDHDTRLPAAYPLLASAQGHAVDIEERLERFHYAPGAFQFGTDRGEGTPSADDRGKSRTDEQEGRALANKRLEAKRSSAKTYSFDTSASDLAPGVVMTISDHPRSEFSDANALLIVESTVSGTVHERSTHSCQARRADIPYRPSISTPKPRVSGVECATVVGAAGDEIHTDEFGRVRVHFHWDRGSSMNERSSCWIAVSQAWGGAGYGGSNLPRVGQEVIVDFLGGNPDRPIITGRVYTNVQKTPYKLPDNKTQSGWKSCSTNQTGGYNEIMFEDASGRELLRMQAEKDLHKLVKNDEEVVVGHDRQKLVKNDDTLTVGNNRVKLVQNDEDVTIGNDRTKLVKHDDDLSVGNDRTKLIQNCSHEVVGQNRTRKVGVNETVSIGSNHKLSVGSSQNVDIGASQSIDIGASHSTSVASTHTTTVGAAKATTVGGAHALTVGLASAETIGLAKALTVGAAYEVTVGAIMNTKVLLNQSEDIGVNKTVTVGKKLELVCGKAKIIMEASGKIVFSTGGPLIAMDDKNITVVAPSGTVTIAGGPNVHINPK